MDKFDVVVAGAGISGLSFAYRAARAGKQVLVLESGSRPGGSLDSRRTEAGYWFELGAHTAYNSYGGLLEIIEGCGLADKLVPRAKVPFKLYRDGGLLSIGKELSVARALLSAPRIFFTKKEGKTVKEYYSRLVGRRNYDKVLGPFLAAVPSQSADDFPATMLFKKRPRRKDVLRSFTLDGGLGAVIAAIGGQPGITVRTGAEVASVAPEGEGFVVTTAAGASHRVGIVALAAPPPAAASMVRAALPELAEALERIAIAPVHTIGVVVDKTRLSIDAVAGIVPADDIFFSAVSRDTVPDEHYRAFAFHFKPGHDRDECVVRIAEVLGVGPTDLLEVCEKQALLPSPVRGHVEITEAIDRQLAGTRLAVTGNYFAGLAIEDCIERSSAEAARVTAAA